MRTVASFLLVCGVAMATSVLMDNGNYTADSNDAEKPNCDFSVDLAGTRITDCNGDEWWAEVVSAHPMCWRYRKATNPTEYAYIWPGSTYTTTDANGNPLDSGSVLSRA